MVAPTNKLKITRKNVIDKTNNVAAVIDRHNGGITIDGIGSRKDINETTYSKKKYKIKKL